MSYGKGIVSEAATTHKHQLATGKIPAGNVEGFRSGNQTRATSSAIGELGDKQRGIGTSSGSQAAPGHGDRGKDHHRRGGLL